VARFIARGKTWDSGDTGDNATWGHLQIKIQGQFEISREKVP
jgi:hypothetical protein